VAVSDNVRVGASGLSFKDWRGPFYPESISASRMLEYYSGVFDVVEINSSYYRMPTARMFAGMVRATDPDFGFVVKLHASMTHGRDGSALPFADFTEALRPLEECGRLLGLLAQFPYEFRRSDDNLSYLRLARSRLERFPFFAEFRHDSWLGPETFEELRAMRAGWCSVDEPQLKGLMPPVAEATAPTAYVRFHGRNSDDWWTPRPGSDRYLYDYSERELLEWVPKIESLSARCESVLMFFNNCHFGNAPKNAKEMKKLLGLPAARARRGGELEFD